MINYFFRGRIEAQISDDGDGIEITNISNDGIVNPDSPTTFQAGGAFEVYYVTDTDEHKPLLSLTNLALGSSLSVNGVHTITGLTAALQGVSDLGVEQRIIVLFDGDIGTERGLAVASILPRIAFIPAGGGLYVMNGDGTGLRQVNISNFGSLSGIFWSWSPDRSKLIFVNSNLLNLGNYYANADGSNISLITDNNRSSPVGRQTVR